MVAARRSIRLFPWLVLWSAAAPSATAAAAAAAPPVVSFAEGRAVHAFFYLWYGTPEQDGEWRHWDHSVLPHWTKSVQAQFPPEGAVAWRPVNAWNAGGTEDIVKPDA